MFLNRRFRYQSCRNGCSTFGALPFSSVRKRLPLLKTTWPCIVQEYVLYFVEQMRSFINSAYIYSICTTLLVSLNIFETIPPCILREYVLYFVEYCMYF